MWGALALLEVRRRFLVGSGRPSMLMLVRSAAALATMRPREYGFITFQFQIYTKNQKTKGTCREHHGEVEALRRGGAGRGQAGAQARRCSCDR